MNAFRSAALSLLMALPSGQTIGIEESLDSTGLSALQVLASACATALRDGVCPVAAGYPSSGACRLEASGEVAVGVWKHETRFILLPYRSNCEPHLHDWGGSLLVEQQRGIARFVGYVVGLAGIDGCIGLAGGEEFVCRHRYVGLGFELSAISLIRILRGGAELRFARTELVRAADTRPTFGGIRIACDRGEKYVALAKPRMRPDNRGVAASVLFVENYATARACEALKAAPADGAWTVDVSSALARGTVSIDFDTQVVTLQRDGDAAGVSANMEREEVR